MVALKLQSEQALGGALERVLEAEGLLRQSALVALRARGGAVVLSILGSLLSQSWPLVQESLFRPL